MEILLNTVLSYQEDNAGLSFQSTVPAIPGFGGGSGVKVGLN
jgi:hypothetical protein